MKRTHNRIIAWALAVLMLAGFVFQAAAETTADMVSAGVPINLDGETNARVYLRSGPSADSGELDTIRRGKRVFVLMNETSPDDGSMWSYVVVDETEGYIRSEYITLDSLPPAPVETETETPEPESRTSGNYEYIVSEDGTAEIIGYSGSDAELVIPDHLDGFKVTGIGDNAFAYCYSLTSVTIPDSVTRIGINPFVSCDKLTDIILSFDHPSLSMINGALYSRSDKRLVCCLRALDMESFTIPDGIQIVGTLAFCECNSLTSIMIPDSVTDIENYAFGGCGSLTAVTIPDSVTSIGWNPFVDCEKLTDIRVSADHPILATADGVLFSRPDRRLVCYPSALPAETYAIPDGVQIIGSYAFLGCTALTHVTIPDSVTAIEQEAFSCCISMTAVTIPNSVTSIGKWAFWSCLSLANVTFADQAADTERAICIGNYAFSDCDALTVVKISDSVVSIGDYVFGGCSSLTAVSIPDSVTSIGINPFANCGKLTDIIVSDNHPYLITVDGVLFSRPDKRLVCYPCGLISESYIIPDGVQMVETEAFGFCRALISVTIPDSVTGIGQDAFYGCENLMIKVAANSYAEQYCKENNLVYAYSD